MSARGVTVSTVGLVPRINQLTEEGIPVTLALSLHAPDDELRNELVPINTRFSVAETVAAAWNYARVTKRRVSIEYAMMRGINDQGWRADLLAEVLNGVRRLGLGARQPDPAQPHAGLEVDRLRPGRRARVRPAAGVARHPHHRPRHPRPRDRRRLRTAGRHRVVSVPAEAVAAASREWVWVPETAVTVETPEYLLARMPDWFDVQLELLRLDPERPVGDVVDEVIARARELGGPEVNCWAKLHNDPSLDAVLLARGGVLDETLDVLALDLTDGLPDVGPWDERIDVRWVTDAATARDHHEVGMVVFGGEMAPDDELERAAADGRRQLPAGEGGAVVAYLDGVPVGAGGIAQPGDVARLWGGSVREEARGLGVYRALLDARLRYGRDHGATMALVKGRIQTSGPILRRAGFERYGEERSYLVPLG